MANPLLPAGVATARPLPFGKGGIARPTYPNQPPLGQSSAAQVYAQLFGTGSPQIAVQQRQQGGPPSGSSGPSSFGPVQAPGLPPPMAGMAQSAAPGLQNGNPANGYPTSVGGFSSSPFPQFPGNQPAPPAGKTGPGAAPLTLPNAPPPEPAPDPAGAPPPILPVEPPPAPPPDLPFQLLAPPAAPGGAGERDVSGALASTEDPVDPRQQPESPGAPPPSGDGSATDPPPILDTGEPDNPTGRLIDPGDFDDTGFIGTGGNQFAFTDPQVDWQKINNARGNDNQLQLAYIQGSDGAWTQGFYANALGAERKGGPLPNPNDVSYSITIDGTDLPDSIFNQVGNKPVQNLLVDAHGWATKIAQLEQDEGATKDAGRIADLNRKLTLALAALEQYGINYNPGSGVADPDSPDDIFGDPLAGPDTQIQTNLPLVNNLLSKDVLAALGNPKDPAGRAAAYALELARFIEEDSRVNRQKGINVLDDSRTDFVNNPLYQSILSQTADIAGQDNLDFTGIKNQFAADQNALNQQGVDQLSSLMARLGGTSGDALGLQSELSRAHARDTARGLGDLNIMEQEMARNFALQNLGVTQGAFGATAGPLAQLDQQVAQAIMTGTVSPFNPGAGALSLSSDLIGLDLQRDAIDEAEDQANMNNYIGAATGLAGLLGGFGGLFSGIGALGAAGAAGKGAA